MLSACSESTRNSKTQLNALRENQGVFDAELEQKIAAKVRVDENIKAFMETRWNHYMK